MAAISSITLSAEVVDISTANTTLLLDATKGKTLNFLYYGDRLSAADADAVKASGYSKTQAYPAYGKAITAETALAVEHADGCLTLDLVVDNVAKEKVNGADVTTVTLKDAVYPFAVDVKYRTYPDAEVIETWTEITHREPGDVTLEKYASGYLPIRYGNVWISQLHGAWANETQLEEMPLPHGMHVIKNKDGARNSQTSHAEVMFSLDGQPREDSGRVIGAALCYSGNFALKVDTDNSDYHQFFAGINEDNSEYHLPAGVTFVTPELALTYSDKGVGEVSRNFHRWGRNHKLAHGNKPRKVLLNSWEGVYFDIKEKEMAQMMTDIADMGGELFVMDDGWFGDKYHRDNSTPALGDWTVDTRKLPHGIKGLCDAAKKRGISFGIWIEPEMVDTMSRLYEEHPEYAIKNLRHKTFYGRGGDQLVLDMANPEVQNVVYSIVDTLLTKYPQIDYIKWDCNNFGRNHGSTYLTADNQSHRFVDYHNGLKATCERIRAKYPDVTIQACASGGGRVNWGVLPYFDEFWTSDNTDALQRVYIQWGTSYFFPAIAMGSHISAAPNHQTYRTIPLKYRIDVAMSGRLGMEIQPKDMTDAEKALCRNAIKEYKQVRDVIQLGDLYRLQSPFDGKGIASLMYVDEPKDQAVFYWYRTENFRARQYPRVTMAGLDPDKYYRVTELNRIDRKPLKVEGKTFKGSYLMSTGIDFPFAHDLPKSEQSEYSSRVLRLEAVK